MLHPDLGIGEAHIPYYWQFATDHDRENAEGILPSQQGRLARQLDEDSIWMLVTAVPLVWSRVSGNMKGRVAALDELLPPSVTDDLRILGRQGGAVGWVAAPDGTGTTDLPQVMRKLPDGQIGLIRPGNQMAVQGPFEIGLGATLEIGLRGQLVLNN